MARGETFVIYFTDNTKKCIWCRKNEIEQYVTVAELRKLDHIQQLNRGDDKVNHRPFTITL